MLNDKIAKELPPAPKDLIEWIIRNAPEKTYLIFNKKKKEVRCTRCGSVFTVDECLDPVVHNSGGSCWYCGAIAEYKESRYGRKELTEYGRVLVFMRKRQTIYAILSEYIIDYQGERPEVSANPTDIYKLNKNIQKRYRYCVKRDGSCGEWREGWHEEKNIIVPGLSSGGYWFMNKFERVTVYDENFSIFEKSDFKYDDVQTVVEGYKLSAYDIIKYLTQCAKYPSIEMLRKGGFEEIVKERLAGYGKDCTYIKGDSLKKILKLSDMSEVRMFAYKGVGTKTIECYKMLKSRGIKCKTFEEVTELEKLLSSYDKKGDIERIEETVSIKRVLKYFRTQPKNERNLILSDYRDYLRECRDLGMNLNDERILFPRNLREAHRRASDECLRQSEKIKRKRQKEWIKECAEKMEKRAEFLSQFNYSNGSLLIRAAITCDEITDEGKEMRHCVGSYAERAANGKTNIFFVRKVSEPDKPYYTLELSEGKKRKIVQCRAKCNGDMTDEVKAFVEEWEKNIVNGKKSRKMEAA